jgi:hypothetical protein
MPFHHGRRFGEYQGVEDLRPHSVKAHPKEPIGGMKPEASTDVAGKKLEFQRRTTAKPEREQIEWSIMPPDRAAITQEIPKLSR